MTKYRRWKQRIRERMRKTGESYTAARQHLLRSLVRETSGFEVHVTLPDGRPAAGVRVGVCAHAGDIDADTPDLLTPRGLGKRCRQEVRADDDGRARFPELDASFAGFFVARQDGVSGRSCPVGPVGCYPIVLDEPIDRGQLRLRFEGSAWPLDPDAWLEFEVRTPAGDMEHRLVCHPERRGFPWPAWFCPTSERGCELDDLPLGPVEVTMVRFAGYHVRAPVAARVDRERVHEVTLRLGEPSTLDGRVYWPSGAPVRAGRLGSTALKPDGRFTLPGLPSALPVRLELDGTPGLARQVVAPELVVDALARPELNLQVELGPKLRVIDEAGAPVASADVSGTGVGGRTDAEGVLRLPPRLEPCRLWVRADGYQERSLFAPEADAVLTLQPDLPPATIALCVRDAEGRGLPAKVHFESDLSPGSRLSGTEQCTPDGTAEWSVPASRTDLKVTLPGYHPATERLQPEPNQRLELDLTLAAKPPRERVAVRGVVHGELPGPRFRYQVWATPHEGGEGHSSRVRDGGSFDLGLLPAGTYDLRVYQQGRPFGEATRVDAQAVETPLHVELRVGATPDS